MNRLRYATAFVVNPSSGSGRAGAVWSRLERTLQERRQPYQVYFTRYPGDGITQAEKARAAGAELLVAVGGDGTAMEVANGMDLQKNIFGLIPAGTGNGYRRCLHIPGNPILAFEGLWDWDLHKVDIGKVNGRYFLNMVGIGFDAAVARRARRQYRLIKGYTALTTAYFSELNEFRAFPVTAHCECLHLEEKDVLLAAVANGSYYGGYLRIAPQARPDDGHLDLCLVKRGYLPQILGMTVLAFMGKHLEHPNVQTYSCREVEIRTGEQVPLHVDGEVVEELPALISILPGGLTVIAPPAVNSS